MKTRNRPPYDLTYDGGMTPSDKNGNRSKITVSSAPKKLTKGIKRQHARLDRQNSAEAEKQRALFQGMSEVRS